MTIRKKMQPFKTYVLLPVIILISTILSSCSVSQPVITPDETIPPPSSPPPLPAEPAFPSGPVYTPGPAPYIPSGVQAELFQYVLELINNDRRSAGVEPVTLNYNAAAQKHARDMFDNYFLAHWGTDGLKPYMRYTRQGGLGYEQENSAYAGWFNREDNPERYENIDPHEIIQRLEHSMMYDDAKSNWGHRDAIINKLHKKVNIGLVYDDKRLALVQQFEGDYVEYILPPTLLDNTLSLSGKIFLGRINNITICYDELPEPLEASQLVYGNYHQYTLGERVAYVIPPAPAGQFYRNLPPEAIQADIWSTNESGQFHIQADISYALNTGKGVYTIVIVADVDEESANLTNYSIFIE